MLRRLLIASCLTSAFTLSLPAFASCEGNSDGEYIQDLQEPIVEAMVDSNMGADAKVSFCLSGNRALGASYVFLRQGGRMCRILFVNLAILGNSCIKSSDGAQQCVRRGGSCYSGEGCCSGLCSNVVPGAAGYCY
jgi:hypothetical protein